MKKTFFYGTVVLKIYYINIYSIVIITFL